MKLEDETQCDSRFNNAVMICIGVGTGGGAPGARPPPPPISREGGQCPTARAMPVHVVIGLTMGYHIKFQE